MENDSKDIISLKPSKGLFLFTLLLGVIPFFIYGWGIYTGSLPDQEEWYARGGNHGPWWDSDWASFIDLPLWLLGGLGFWSFVIGVFESAKLRKFAPFAHGLAFSILQLSLAHAQLVIISWTVL